jgi:ATP-dependent Lon protease
MQELLETLDVSARLDRLLALLAHQLEVLKISDEIGKQTREAFDERQREAVLREQMRTIRKELGEGEERAEELSELTRAIDNANLPEDIHRQALKELRRLERMGESSAESAQLRTWLEWLSELPWQQESKDRIDIPEARAELEADHYGLDKVKRRILEYLAVRKLNPGGKSPILCFVGPPGVGKTSLGSSIARALGRVFGRVSLGGVHDEA